jgi:hypothetical protein
MVARVLARRARHGEVGEAIAGRVRAPGRAVALRAAEAATGARSARETAEPFAARVAAVGASGTRCARLALPADAGARRSWRPARVAGPAAAAHTAGDRAERDVCAGEEEAGPERAGSEQLEELAAGRPPGQLPGSVRSDVHVTRR